MIFNRDSGYIDKTNDMDVILESAAKIADWHGYNGMAGGLRKLIDQDELWYNDIVLVALFVNEIAAHWVDADIINNQLTICILDLWEPK